MEMENLVRTAPVTHLVGEEPPDWRDRIRDLLDELRDERIGRPSRKLDDEDLVNGIEDLMDYAFKQGIDKRKTAVADKAANRESLL